MTTRHAFRFAAACLLASAFCAGAVRAETADDIKTAFARAVYQSSTDKVHDMRPQPLLRAVVVLRIRLDADNRWAAEVFRDNPQQPEMTRVALESVARLPPPQGLSAATLAQLRGEGLIEAWLFENDGRFALKSLAKPQRGA